MNFWRQLRWRIAGAQMLVVLVGVVVVLVVALLFTQGIRGANVAAQAGALLAAGDLSATQQEALLAAANELAAGFRESVLLAVGLAALSAIAAGLVTSLLLSREIVRPLQQLAQASERIAGGHYGERMAVPRSDELAQVANSFNQMAQALAEVEQTRVSLLGDVSHELRTPLTSLSGYLEGMLDGVFPCDEETLALMYQEVRRMRRLVGDLQMLSRVEAGQISLNMGTFDVTALVQRAVAKLQPQWQAARLAVEVQGPSRPLLVYADPDRVDQILINLLGNALAYSAADSQIRVTIAPYGRFARVSVIDQGIGIDPAQIPYLFERFFRADRSRARGSGGSGIGLTISRHLSWALGGELSAESAGPGQGSTFSFTLPLAQGPTGEKSA